MSSALAEGAARLRALHESGEPLLLPNAWDVSSALAVERAGAAAIATTSSGVAATLGYPDGESIPVEEMLTVVERIATAVRVPVTADMEAGYGLPADDLVRLLLAAGAVGMNLEDTDRSTEPPGLVPVRRQAERIGAIRAAATEQGIPIVLNARIDTFLRGDATFAERLEDGLDRARAYAAAGADCVYPIWLVDGSAIGRFVRETDVPVNVLLRPGAPSLAKLVDLGVRRISVGGGLARHADSHVQALAESLLRGDDAAFRELGEA